MLRIWSSNRARVSLTLRSSGIPRGPIWTKKLFFGWGVHRFRLDNHLIWLFVRLSGCRMLWFGVFLLVWEVVISVRFLLRLRSSHLLVRVIYTANLLLFIRYFSLFFCIVQRRVLVLHKIYRRVLYARFRFLPLMSWSGLKLWVLFIPRPIAS